MLMRFDPLREFDRLSQEVASAAANAPRTFPMDAYRRGDDVVLLFDLPGVDPESIDLTVDQHVLTVRAERRPAAEENDEQLDRTRARPPLRQELLEELTMPRMDRFDLPR